ncbi:E3 ubiquitin-protein ligase TRIM39-like [Pempheris klunzingeri]|uniref:E3 ubiquitin-protein ligase TRIM39-like n=1 Tax=Pempheris klunzingeri TaxID=3127111 RepID=UPI00397FA038
MASALSEDQFQCSICLDIFNNPVSTPCGHNFCQGCIKGFWDTKDKYECPLCKDAFKPRPELRINVGLRDITEQFRRSMKSKQPYKPIPKRRSLKQPSKSDNVPCAICQLPDKLTAVKSCLVCQRSYCETHLMPHLEDPVMRQHRLTDPDTFATSHICRDHNKPLEMFCKRDRAPVCTECTERDHKHHDIVRMEKMGTMKTKAQMKKTEAEFQQMIHVRLRKIEEIKDSVEMSKMNKNRQIQTSSQVFSTLVSVIERNRALLVEEIEQKQEAAERRAEELLKELEQEVAELQRRQSELQHLQHTEDTLYLLQGFPSLSAPLATRSWSNVNIDSDNHIGTVRRAFSKLLDICHELEKKLSTGEVSKLSQYAVSVTLDPATAAGWLVLSPDGKKVSVGCQQRKLSLPDDPRRFDSCLSLLGKQSFQSGRHFWMVQVGDKTDWDLGIARESINRKGAITVRPDSGYWAICRRKGGSLSACAGPSVTLHLQDTPKKVGVFLDYEEGSVTFYNTAAKTHIYTYSGCTFTEPLYPYFNPCLHDNGRNTAPLIICPVEFTEETT